MTLLRKSRHRKGKGEVSSMFRKLELKSIVSNYFSSERAVAGIEAALIFPVLLIMLLGTLDLGYGLMANQKVIRASQVTADLMTRYIEVTQADIDEIVQAGRLSLQPYSDESLGFDIVSFRFLDDGTPEIIWRHTENMTEVAVDAVDLSAIAEPGRGVILVTTQYLYEPIIIANVMDPILITERAFARGRRVEQLCMVGASGCS